MKKETHNKIKELLLSQEQKSLEDFFTFLSFKSISTDLQYLPELRACAQWLRHEIELLDFTVDIITDDGPPCLLAERHISDSAPTILIYNHYDVQPAEFEEGWESEPFEPVLKDGEIYARGAMDNKGQCFYILMALRALNELKLWPNINIKWLIEGEEECGSENLPDAIADHAEKLKADHLFGVDFGFHTPEKPAIVLGFRGILSFTLTCIGSATDLHSGEHGGIAFNPLHALVQTLASLRCPKSGKILIDSFYDDVEEISEKEKAELDIDLSPEFYRAIFHAEANGGETEYSPLESAWLRPTLELNGVHGGYAGVGVKTVIPRQAEAKISCRLAPGQDPERIMKLLESTIRDRMPEGIEVQFSDQLDSARALRASAHTKAAIAARESISEITGKDCVNIMSGGSVPILYDIAEVSGAEVVLMGYGLPGDQLHAPNEHFGLNRLHLGAQTMCTILHKLSK